LVIGIDPPKLLSIKLVLASFWLFSAVTVSTYQANLAAFLTSSKLNTKLSSIKSLADQFTIRYSAIGLHDLMQIYQVLCKINTNVILNQQR
jgi:hypothetical protein